MFIMYRTILDYKYCVVYASYYYIIVIKYIIVYACMTVTHWCFSR